LPVEGICVKSIRFPISLIYIAATLFQLNFALALLVQFCVMGTKPFRWLHYVLFFVVFVSAVAGTLAGFFLGAPYRRSLLPVLTLFVVLQCVRAGTLGHAALAGGALFFYAAGLVQAL
jgi:hypothetical protein